MAAAFDILTRLDTFPNETFSVSLPGSSSSAHSNVPRIPSTRARSVPPPPVSATGDSGCEQETINNAEKSAREGKNDARTLFIAMIIAHLPRHLIPESGSVFSGGRKKSGLPFQQTRFGDSESRRFTLCHALGVICYEYFACNLTGTFYNLFNASHNVIIKILFAALFALFTRHIFDDDNAIFQVNHICC